MFVPRVTSLLHLAVAKEAIKLYNGFKIEDLDKANKSIQSGILMTSEDSNGSNSAMKILLRIPPVLRRRIMEAVYGLKYRVWQWKKEHFYILELDGEKCTYYFRYDGTIDTVKTVQQILLNSNIDITKRFYLASMYCLEESIRTLWTEMEATCGTGNLETAEYLVVRFWARWLRDGARVPWKEAARKSLGISHAGILFSSFVTSLRPEERIIYLRGFGVATFDDLRHCLYAVTKQEEEILLKRIPEKILYSYLHWPLRSMFLEIAENILKYFDECTYNYILFRLLSSEINREVFDFYEFFECFWNISPDNLRESVKEIPQLREKVEACLNHLKKKRKYEFDDLRNPKDEKLLEA